MAVNEERILQIISQAVAAAVAQTLEAQRHHAGAGGDKKAGKNMHKFYTRLEKFSDDVTKWKEWHYQFGVATNAYDRKTAELMEAVEKIQLTEVTSGTIGIELEDDAKQWLESTKAELFSVLCLLTAGEANMLVRSCEDRDGYTAWKKLYDRFNPKTPASLTAAWREVVRPKKVKDLREAGRAIDAWEGKVSILKKEHSEEPTPGLKAALLLEMLPDAAQMTVAQGLDSKKLDYDALKAKIKMMANVQIDYATPKPMDIGEMTYEYWDEPQEEVFEDYGVNAVGAGTCHRCGGIGHFARECGTAKGKGKDQYVGVNGKGKSFGKGWNEFAKGSGKNAHYTKGGGKSGGKGKGCFVCGGDHLARDCPQGSAKGVGKGKGGPCYSCGGYGHRAAQCPSGVRAVEQEEDVEGDLKVENVLAVMEVKSSGGGELFRDGGHGLGISEGWRTVRGQKRSGATSPMAGRQESKSTRSPMSVGRMQVEDGSTLNRYAALGNDEPDDEEHWVQHVREEESWKFVGTAEITIDSGADESVCPQDWGRAFHTKDIPDDKKMKFRNASGGKMEHYGEKMVYVKTEDQEKVLGMNFQVSDVKRPLAAVWRIAEKGNLIQFGPRAEDNFILNTKTKEKIGIRRKGRSYVLDGDMVKPHFMRQA